MAGGTRRSPRDPVLLAREKRRDSLLARMDAKPDAHGLGAVPGNGWVSGSDVGVVLALPKLAPNAHPSAMTPYGQRVFLIGLTICLAMITRTSAPICSVAVCGPRRLIPITASQ